MVSKPKGNVGNGTRVETERDPSGSETGGFASGSYDTKRDVTVGLLDAFAALRDKKISSAKARAFANIGNAVSRLATDVGFDELIRI